MKEIRNKMFYYLRNYNLLLFFIFIFSFVYGICNIFIPICIGKIINNITKNTIENIILILIFLYFILFISEVISNSSLNKISCSIARKLRYSIFEKINLICMSAIDNIKVGNILNLINVDVENIVRVLSQTLFKIISGVITILGITIIILKINIILSIILIISAPLMFIVSKNIVNKTNKLFIDRAKEASNLNECAEEFISKSKSIKNYLYEEEAIKKFEKINNNLYNISFKSNFFSSLTNPSSRFIINIIYILLGIIGAIIVQNDLLTIGEISIFLIYVNIYTKPFNEISSFITEIQTAIVSLNRINDFLSKNNEKAIKNDINNINFYGNIKFKNVKFSYNENEKLIENLSFEVNKNEKIAIVGKTGSGKTTIINLLMKFYNLNDGKIYIDGIDINDIPNQILRKNIGMVLQDSKLFYGTIRENITYGSNNVKESDIKRVEKEMNLSSFINRLDNGYDTIIDNKKILSIGEIQLINIARILLLKPPIVILDEATSNVDIITEENIKKAIDKIIENSTSFIIAHKLSTIKNADKILYIENGNLIEQGSHEELIRKKGKYYELYNSN